MAGSSFRVSRQISPPALYSKTREPIRTARPSASRRMRAVTSGIWYTRRSGGVSLPCGSAGGSAGGSLARPAASAILSSRF